MVPLFPAFMDFSTLGTRGSSTMQPRDGFTIPPTPSSGSLCSIAASHDGQRREPGRVAPRIPGQTRPHNPAGSTRRNAEWISA